MRYFFLIFPIIIIFLFPAYIASTNAYASEKGELFDSKEITYHNIHLFPKWTQMVSRYRKDNTAPSLCTKKQPCPLIQWDQFLHSVQNKPKKDQINAVQHYINKASYIIDPINWGVPDYWASPRQFFIKDGDCEDYAIAKFFSLRKLGFNNDDMRVVIVNDANLNTVHSILVVYTQEEAWILDNQLPSIVPSRKIHHYKPIYSLNETDWWLYQPLS